MFGADYLGIGVNLADAILHATQSYGLSQIGLVQQYDISEGDLLFGLVVFAELIIEMYRVCDCYNSIKPRAVCDILVHEKGLRHWRGVSEARRLNNDGVELVGTFHKTAEDPDQIASDGTANAAVVHLKHFFICIHDQVVVDPRLAKFINNHGIFFSVAFGENPIQKCCFSCPEKAR